MVYESDFYTTRRPYRPSTYSVTQPMIRIVPSAPRVHTITTYYPYGTSRLVGAPRTRIVTSPTPPHHLITVRVRPAVVLRELDRIANRYRPAYSYSASEDFLRSNVSKDWEDESRRIRADASSLMRRIHTAVPRASSIVPYSTYASYAEPIPYRFSSEDYLSKLLWPIRSVASDIRNMSWYVEPAKKFTGRGHLSCIRYNGSKGFPIRKPLYCGLPVRDDVTLLSFYAKNRLAAAGLDLDSVTVKLLPWRPTRKFGKPQVLEDPALELKAAKAERLERFNKEMAAQDYSAAAVDADALADRKKRRQEESRLAEEKELAEESQRKKEAAKRDEEARAAEQERQEKLAAQAEAEQQAELERQAEVERQAAEADAKKKSKEEAKKKKVEEEAKKKAEEEARLAEQSRLAEEAKLAEEARQAEEVRQQELARLEELERQAQEEKEAELARQAAELAEIARQESELAAAARAEAELAELARQEAELAELERQEAELAELERQEAELNAQAAAAEESAEAPEAAEAEESAPLVEEPESLQDAASEDEAAEPDLTDEE